MGLNTFLNFTSLVMVSVRHIGIGIIVAAVVLFLIGFAYAYSAEQALMVGHKIGPNGECLHPPDVPCPLHALEQLQSIKHLGLAANLIIFAVGLYLFTSKTPEEKTAQKARKQAKELGGEEAKVFDVVLQANGMIFQNELVEKMGLSKVKVTRILDKLEAKGLIERRRRGMTNAIIIK